MEFAGLLLIPLPVKSLRLARFTHFCLWRFFARQINVALDEDQKRFLRREEEKHFSSPLFFFSFLPIPFLSFLSFGLR